MPDALPTIVQGGERMAASASLMGKKSIPALPNSEDGPSIEPVTSSGIRLLRLVPARVRQPDTLCQRCGSAASGPSRSRSQYVSTAV